MVAALVAGAAIATAGGGPVPPPKPIAVAIHDAITAPPVQGVQADISFTNHLVNGAGLQGGDPVLAGAHGRLWVSDDRLRLELQSDRGDAQIVADGKTVTAYDASQRIAYRAELPAHKDASSTADQGDAPPSLGQIESKLADLAKHVGLSGAEPSDVAGRAAYTVRVSPLRDGGLVGRAELAWDAARGVPLRVALYPRGASAPVLELRAENISFGSVPASTFDFSPPTGTKVVDLRPGGRSGGEAKPVAGVAAVDRAVRFRLAAPPALAGLQRNEVRLIDHGGEPAALVLYGKGLGGIAVLEQPAGRAEKRVAAPRHRDHHGDGAPGLPTVSIGGATGQELDTPLGTGIRFTRGGVTYTVAGSVTPAAAKAAARGL